MKRSIPAKYYLALSVALATAAVYLSALRNSFVELDDPLYVLENSHIRSLNSGFIKWAFLDFYASNWHPLTWISHAVDYAIWGLNPAGHHLTSVILHSINTFLVVVLAIKLMTVVQESTGDKGPSGFLHTRSILTAAGVTGLLFGLHPLHVESVAWISERKDLLCGLFFLLSIMMYTNHVLRFHGESTRNHPLSQHAHKHYILALGFFILALLSKPMAVSLPVVLLILDWYPLNRIRSWKTFLSSFIGKLPFIAFSLAASIVTVLAQASGQALESLDVMPAATRFLVGARSLVLYLWKMIWPLNLIPYYSYPKNVSLLSPEYFLSIVLLAAITAGCLIMVKKQKVWLTAWSCYIVTLIPVIGIVQVGGQPMADRYTYLTSLGPFLMIGLLVGKAANERPSAVRRDLSVKLVKTAMAVFVLAAMTYVTIQQITVWENGMRLWNYIIEKKSDAPLVYYNRGLAFYKSGRLDLALEDINTAIALNPSSFEAYSTRGQIFDKTGRLDRAISDYDMAIALDQTHFQPYYNRGVVYVKMRQFEKAVADFTRTLALNPSLLAAYNSRGTAFFMSAQYDKALADFDRIIAQDPSNYQAYHNRGLTFSKMGLRDKAAKDFDEANKLRSLQ